MLLHGNTVLTCAHVLPDAQSPVTVDFPEIGAAAGSTATVLEDCWIPEQDDTRGDLALLHLHRPQPAHHSAPLLSVAPAAGMQVEMCGYAASVSDGRGVAFAATVSRTFGERVQLNPRLPGYLPRHGFSGGPVLDMNQPSNVLGLVVTGYLDHQGAGPLYLAHMIPIDTVVGYLPRVRRWVTGLPGVEPSVASRGSADRPVDAGYARRLADWLGGRGASPVHVTEARPGSRRDHTLRRALLLADRALSSSASGAPATGREPATPPVGSCDLALDAAGRTADEVVVRVAERLNLPRPGPRDALAALRTAGMPLTIAVLGVDGAVHPEDIVALCGEFAEFGCRQLLVFTSTGASGRTAVEQALTLRYRLGRLAERLEVLSEQVRVLAADARRLEQAEPPDEAVTRLWQDLVGILSVVRDGTRESVRADTPLPPRVPAGVLDHLEERTAGAEQAAAHARERADRGYRQRGQLRAELETYRGLAALHGRIEDVALEAEYQEAHRALYRGRFVPDRARAAVARYVRGVRRELYWPAGEGERP